MRGLKEFQMPLILFVSIFFHNFLFCGDLSNYLTKEKQKILDIEKEIDNKSATNLKYNWIKPIVASYSYSRNNQIGKYSNSKFFRVSFDQPIFKSGGIYFAIDYAKANKNFRDVAYSLRKSKLIKKLYQEVLNLKKIDLEIKKLQLSIKNAQIDIKRKKEQFNNGFLDSSFLDNAILNKRKLSQNLISLKNRRFSLIQKFKDISDADYKSIELPKIEPISKDEFLSQNLEIKTKIASKNELKELKNMTISSYLPTLSLYGSYNNKDDQIQFFKQAKEYKNFGIRASMPIFSINFNRDIEIKKLNYLKAQIELKEQLKRSKREFLSIQNSINLLTKQVELASSDISLYSDLVKNTKEQYKAGDKSLMDLKTLQNSKLIASYQMDIYKIERELEILKLYEKISDKI